MKMKLMKITAIVVSSAWLAGSAAADLIAGWDFSQYKVDGALTTDGSTFVDTLPANYSSLDATFGAGGTDPGDSADFGTFYMDGTFGSSNVNESAPSPGPSVVPHAHDTKANRNAPLDVASGSAFPINVFDAFNVQKAEGQDFQSRLGLTARASEDVVFRADRGSPVNAAWGVSFAAWALDATGPVSIDVEFAADCSSYSMITSVVLSESEQAFDVPLSGSILDDETCVRLSLDASNGQPVIDNVAVYVPEPGHAAMMITGILSLVGLKRRRRA